MYHTQFYNRVTEDDCKGQNHGIHWTRYHNASCKRDPVAELGDWS
jgi:hypothetical protein